MKRKGIIFVLFALTIISMSCSNSKAVVVGAGEKSAQSQAENKNTEQQIIKTQEIQRAPNPQKVEAIRQNTNKIAE